MRKVSVNRPQKIKFPFMKGKILINGVECETVKAGKTAVFDVPDGNHDIQVTFPSVPPTASNVLRIDSLDGDTNFEIKIKVPISGNDPTLAELTKK